VCVCVCVCARARGARVCGGGRVCVCVCVWRTCVRACASYICIRVHIGITRKLINGIINKIKLIDSIYNFIPFIEISFCKFYRRANFR